jgi:hypothetical protein
MGVTSKDKERVMKKRMTHALLAAGISAAVGVTSISANAAPIFPQQPMAVSAPLILASNRDFRWRGDRPYYHGHRGSRHRRHGYREYNGFWFPLAAFGLGAAIGSTLPRSGNAHVEWCYGHYRSYRAYDNTYQPYNGPRRPCYSPYS